MDIQQITIGSIITAIVSYLFWVFKRMNVKADKIVPREEIRDMIEDQLISVNNRIDHIQHQLNSVDQKLELILHLMLKGHNE